MRKELLDKGLELIKHSSAVFLTTIDTEGFPSTRAMLNLRNPKQFPELVPFMEKFEDGFTLFFTTNTSSIKIKQIMHNPKVSVYYCDTKTWHGLMCQGNIEIVTDKSIKHAMWLDSWKMYYPEGKDSEDYAILKLEPSYIKTYYKFQQEDQKL
jgi:general stress protein 26